MHCSETKRTAVSRAHEEHKIPTQVPLETFIDRWGRFMKDKNFFKKNLKARLNKKKIKVSI